jgi:hypothetical protein
MINAPYKVVTEEKKAFYYEINILKQVPDGDTAIGICSKVHFNFDDRIGFATE